MRAHVLLFMFVVIAPQCPSEAVHSTAKSVGDAPGIHRRGRVRAAGRHDGGGCSEQEPGSICADTRSRGCGTMARDTSATTRPRHSEHEMTGTRHCETEKDGSARRGNVAARGSRGGKRNVRSCRAGGPRSTPMCQFPEGCSRGASFGEVLSDERLYCARHRGPHHEDKKHKLCTTPGCRRQGSFRSADGTGERTCAMHSRGVRLSIGTTPCNVSGCSNEATHAPRHQDTPAIEGNLTSGQKIDDTDDLIMQNTNETMTKRRCSRSAGPLWCARHCAPGAIDVRKHGCGVQDCHLRATHGDPGQVPVFCALHRLPGHIDRRHKRCQYSSTTGSKPEVQACARQPSYGDALEGVARFCAKHRSPQHVDVRSRLCEGAGCWRIATFGEASQDESAASVGGAKGKKRPRFCRQHKEAWHVNVKASTRHRAALSEARSVGHEILWCNDFATVTLVREAAEDSPSVGQIWSGAGAGGAAEL